MSLARLPSLSEVIGRRKSVEVPNEKLKRQQGDQDYVLVEESEHDSDHQEDDGVSTPFNQSRSPAATSLGLVALSGTSTEDGSETADIPLSTKALAEFRARSAEIEDESIDTTRTDYSGLASPSLPEIVDRDEALQQALEEANQQHQWAMEAVMRGWEQEKADLLAKLERVVEARDTLEEELKHSEHHFGEMLEGILDQKLEHMMHVLQEGNLTRSLSGTIQLDSPNSQSTILHAQQVANDLGNMLETMRAQQATVEDRVASMQQAVLQLVPESEPVEVEEAAPTRGRALRFAVGLREKIGRSARHSSSFVGSKAVYLRHKVPELVTHTAQRTGGAARSSLSYIRSHVSQVANFQACKQHLRKEHLRAFTCLLTGAVVASILASRRPKRARALPQPQAELVQAEEPTEEVEVFEVQPEEDSVLDESVEIVLNRSGVFRRYGRDPDRTLVLAWPRISVEYN